MTIKTKKFTSFTELSKAFNGNTSSPDKWAGFLKLKGHTEVSFSYLPDDIKTALRFSFARKN